MNSRYICPHCGKKIKKVEIKGTINFSDFNNSLEYLCPLCSNTIDVEMLRRWGIIYEAHIIRPEKCPDCCAFPGEQHIDGCDNEICTVCHRQRLQCHCPGHDKEKAKWTGKLTY